MDIYAIFVSFLIMNLMHSDVKRTRDKEKNLLNFYFVNLSTLTVRENCQLTDFITALRLFVSWGIIARATVLNFLVCVLMHRLSWWMEARKEKYAFKCDNH